MRHSHCYMEVSRCYLVPFCVFFCFVFLLLFIGTVVYPSILHILVYSSVPHMVSMSRSCSSALRPCSLGVWECAIQILLLLLSWKITASQVSKGDSNFSRSIYSRSPVHLFFFLPRHSFAAGQDCYTKFWCLKTGKLLRTIPPPCPASRETIPAVQYSSQWGCAKGNQGLIMGQNDTFYLYSCGVEDSENWSSRSLLHWWCWNFVFWKKLLTQSPCYQ